MIKGLIAKYKTLRQNSTLLRFRVLVRLGRWLLPRYRFKWPHMAWWDDRAFNRYLDQFQEAEGLNTDRRWMLSQLIRLVKAVPGDTVECGAYKGAGSYLMLGFNETDGGKRTHFIFDSFEGLSTPADVDGDYWHQGDLSTGMQSIRQNLAGFTKVRLCKGWIPDRFGEVEARRFAFVHIDVDLYQPTFESMRFFYPRLNTGGIILCDDYGFTSCPGATRALDEFLADKPEKMISLSGGGGFMIKGCPTAAPWNPLPRTVNPPQTETSNPEP